MGKGRWVLLGVGAAALAVALIAGATSLALPGTSVDWGFEARAAAKKSILVRVSDEGDMEFADVQVRETGNDDERWVCGSFAVRDEDGALGPFRDFWVTVTKVPDTSAGARDVRANQIGQDDFLNRNSTYFRSCFADEKG